MRFGVSVSVGARRGVRLGAIVLAVLALADLLLHRPEKAPAAAAVPVAVGCESSR